MLVNIWKIIILLCLRYTAVDKINCTNENYNAIFDRIFERRLNNQIFYEKFVEIQKFNRWKFVYSDSNWTVLKRNFISACIVVWENIDVKYSKYRAFDTFTLSVRENWESDNIRFINFFSIEWKKWNNKRKLLIGCCMSTNVGGADVWIPLKRNKMADLVNARLLYISWSLKSKHRVVLSNVVHYFLLINIKHIIHICWNKVKQGYADIKIFSNIFARTNNKKETFCVWYAYIVRSSRVAWQQFSWNFNYLFQILCRFRREQK